MLEKTVFVTDQYTQESVEILKKNPGLKVIRTDNRPSPDQLKEAFALLIRSRTKIDDEVLKQAPNLKVIITATSGFDHIQLSKDAREKLVLMYTPEANAQSAAEHTLFLILSALKRSTETQRLLRDGRWRDGLTQGLELKNKTLGIIGLGRVGSRVARFAKAFGAHVIAHDPYQVDSVFRELHLDRNGISEVFAQSDILSFHVPLNKETRRMVRQETIELMQDGVVIINASRGQIIDEGALVAALESGEVSAAGLDVFEHEPLARDSRLRKLSNVVITPHMGAYTTEAYSRASLMAAEKLLAFLNGEKPTDLIPD